MTGQAAFRQLQRQEISSIWTIDRSEVIERTFVLQDGKLTLRDNYVEAQGWEPGKAESMTPVFQATFDAGGWFEGAWDGAQLVGVAILEPQFFGPANDMLQLSFLHVSMAHRGNGIGKRLFERALGEAANRGAKRMYVSASATERTVRFYLARGCELLAEPDPALFALEPEDIHFACPVR